MKTTVEALKEVYVSLGGALTDTYSTIADGVPVSDYSTNPDVIAAISERAASAGIELPAVTSADNGDVLTVVNGAWGKATLRKPVAVYIPSDDEGAPDGMELKKCISYIEGGIYHIMAEMYVPSGTVFRRNSNETVLLAASRANLPIDYPSGGTTGTLFNVGYAGQIVKKIDLDNPRESAAPIKLQMGGGTNGIVYIRLDLAEDTTYTVESGYEYFYIEAQCFVRTT